MKKILFTALLACSLITANAQFKSSPSGVISVDGNAFYIANVEGKSAKELYSSVESYIMSNFKNPDVVSNKQDGEMINLHGVFTKAYPCIKWAGINYADVDLNIVMYFKDGRIRFDIPTVNKMTIPTLQIEGRRWSVHFSGGMGKMFGELSMFSKKGNIENEMAVQGFDLFINKLVSDIVQYASSSKNIDW